MVKDKGLLLALVVVVLWGTNFSVITVAEQAFPPFFLVALRFFLCFFPIIFFIRKPDVSWSTIFWYGMLFGVMQFGFLFFGMEHGAGPGESSFILQSQVFFTIILSSIIFKESIKKYQIAGLIIGALGIIISVIATNKSVAITSSLLIILAGLSWGGSNLVIKKHKPKNMFSFMVYACAAATIPMLLLTVIFEDPNRIIPAFKSAHFSAYLSIIYIVYLATLLCYSVWNRLLNDYSAATITPFALLIPVIGMIVAVIFRHEHINSLQIVGFILVAIGLIICQLWPRISGKIKPVVVRR